MTIRASYDRWPQYNQRLTEVVAAMTDEQLAIRPSPEGSPIWATVGHTAGARAYWLCGVLKEPGAEATPWPDALTWDGWEDHLDHPRTATELVWALDSTWAVVDRVLDTWEPSMLPEEVERCMATTAAPLACLDPPATPDPRRLPLRRAVTDARDRGPPPDRPLAPKRLVGRVAGGPTSFAKARPLASRVDLMMSTP